MSRSPWRFAPYAFVAAGAITGQILAGFAHLQPTSAAAIAGICLVAVAIELGAVWMAYLAKGRGELGESVVPFFVISTLFALLAVGINVLGHWGDLWGVAVFGGLSAAGYVIWCFELNALLDDTWDPDGSIRRHVPSMRILKKFCEDSDLASRARRIALVHAQTNIVDLRGGHMRGLGPAQAIARALDERAQETRLRRIEEAVRQVMRETGANKIDIDLAMLAYGPDEITRGLIEQAPNADMAAALGTRISPVRLTGVNAPKPKPLKASSEPPPPDAEPRKSTDGKPKEEPKPAPERRALPSGPTRTAPADPWDKYARQLRAVMTNIPDWYDRDTPVSTSHVEGAFTVALANGTLTAEEAKTSKPYLLRVKWMIEAMSKRGVPEDQWQTGSLKDVNREGLDERRTALLAY